MNKKITVYILKSESTEKVYPTIAQAKQGQELLQHFGITAEITKEKKVISLS